jgi:hypothetical protein
MGHQIQTTDFRREINFTAGAWLVMSWIKSFTPTRKPEGMSDVEWFDEINGVSKATPEAVILANSKVPFLFERARVEGAISDPRIREDEFEECRLFLSYAAENRCGITGSW